MNLHDIAPRLARARDQWNERQQIIRALQQVGWHIHLPETCPRTGKRRYASRKDARDALARVQARPGRPECRIHRCEFCREWHLTSRPQARARVHA